MSGPRQAASDIYKPLIITEENNTDVILCFPVFFSSVAAFSILLTLYLEAFYVVTGVFSNDMICLEMEREKAW